MSEASVLQWLPALLPSTAPRSNAAIPWARASQVTLRQLAVKAPYLSLAFSRLSVVKWRVAAFFAQPDLQIVELSASDVDLTIQLSANHGLGSPDALQAACCLELGPDALMDKGDTDFLGQGVASAPHCFRLMQ